MKHPLLFLVAGLLCLGTANAQITSNNSLTPQQMVQQVLLGAGVTATNITFAGNPAQIATFTATPSTSLGIPRGVLLSSGTALTSSPDGPQGPNLSPGTTTDFSSFAGDTDLNNIVAPLSTQDAAVLEFDFVPQSDTIRFRYVFGSEEYSEFVGSQFNDVFGFFLSGGTTSPLPLTNIARIPGSTTPISINNVNNGWSSATVPTAGPCTNCTYFVDNTGMTVDVQFDGLTVVLTAKQPVYCGEVYHIKIAIADVGDGSLDSGVFLEAGSFASIPPLIVSTANASSNAVIPDSVMVEDCNENCVYFLRSGSISQLDSFQLQVSGNAILGTDYIDVNNPSFSWPNKLYYNPGQDTLKFCNLKALEDFQVEGSDTILFTISRYLTPGQQSCAGNSVTFALYIQDYHPVVIGQGDTLICNGQSIQLNAQAQSGIPAYSYLWQPGGTTASSLSTGALTQPTTYTIGVGDECGKHVSKAVTVIPSTLPVLLAQTSYTICMDTLEVLNLTINGGKPAFNINWNNPVGMPPVIAPLLGNLAYTLLSTTQGNGTYTVTVTDQCLKSDSIGINVSFVDCQLLVPNVVTANGDGINDIFRVKGLENFPNSTLTVYNRWGRKLYDDDNYKNDWKPDMNSGTYFYVLEITDGRKFNGFFQLFKD